MKSKLVIVSLVCLAIILFVGATILLIAVPEAEISLISYDRDELSADSTLTKSLGIPNVGVGEKVYLIGNKDDTNITGYTWTLTPPTGSSSTSTSPTTFRNAVPTGSRLFLACQELYVASDGTRGMAQNHPPIGHDQGGSYDPKMRVPNAVGAA